MINHLRTLLLNEPADLSAENEQYVPATFQSVPLPADAAAVRAAMIDPDWPRAYRNHVATLLSNVAMASPFAEWIDRLDDRTTLSPWSNSVTSLRDKVTVEKVTAADSLAITGTFLSRPANGIFSGAWRLRKVDDTHISILNLKDAGLRTVAVTFTGDTTGPILVDPTNTLSFQLIGVSTVPTGFDAIVQASNSMTYDTLVRLTHLRSDPAATDIFRQKDDTAVMSMLSDAFHNSQRPDLALAAVLTAYAYRLKDYR